ncbi:MAG: RNA-binding S4 domain-containing protein [Rhodospirillaceae bacterium]|nr:MAG: RNA-binding S4 domain-containing protein [Rhodospirillaceae bacterium]
MTSPSLRLDKWLWFARFVKTRADAQKIIERGQITLNDRVVEKTSTVVRPGDVLTIVLASVRHVVTVEALGVRRGPAPEAQALYTRLKPLERLGFEDAALPLHPASGSARRRSF